MPGLTPGRRWQPAYYPFHRESLINDLFLSVERMIKGVLFGCRMCGNCLLQETAFICPMECPKGLRNGPCGGSTPDHCYVDPTRPCIWFRIYQRADGLGRLEHLQEVLPPLDWDKVGTATWADVINLWRERGGVKAAVKWLRSSKEQKAEDFDRFFYDIRQPEWWGGDSVPHPAPEHEPVSVLEEKMTAGRFVITGEISPPLASTPDELVKKINLLRDYVDAINFTDNPSATARLSSLASALICIQNGVEPVLQIAARDYTRMSIQSTVLGAISMGVRNILCLTGDHARMGPTPHGKMDIWDIDAIQMIWILRKMRDEQRLLDGREIKSGVPVFIGAGGSPNASLPRYQGMREAKKVNAGAQYIQTNLVYDIDNFEEYLAELDKYGVLDRSTVMPGVAPIRSLKAAETMNRIPGIRVPQAILKRLADSSDPKEEGIQIALEIVDRIKRLPGIKGIHFMSVTWESVIPRIILESGLRSKPA